VRQARRLLPFGANPSKKHLGREYFSWRESFTKAWSRQAAAHARLLKTNMIAPKGGGAGNAPVLPLRPERNGKMKSGWNYGLRGIVAPRAVDGGPRRRRGQNARKTPPWADRTKEEPTIVAIRIVKEDGQVLSEIAGWNHSGKPGKTLDREKIAESLRTLYRTGGICRSGGAGWWTPVKPMVSDWISWWRGELVL